MWSRLFGADSNGSGFYCFLLFLIGFSSASDGVERLLLRSQPTKYIRGLPILLPDSSTGKKRRASRSQPDGAGRAPLPPMRRCGAGAAALAERLPFPAVVAWRRPTGECPGPKVRPLSLPSPLLTSPALESSAVPGMLPSGGCRRRRNGATEPHRWPPVWLPIAASSRAVCLCPTKP